MYIEVTPPSLHANYLILDFKLHAKEKALLYHRIRNELIANVDPWVSKHCSTTDPSVIVNIFDPMWPTSITQTIFSEVIDDLQHGRGVPPTLTANMQKLADNCIFSCSAKPINNLKDVVLYVYSLFRLPFYGQNKLGNKYYDLVEFLHAYSEAEYLQVTNSTIQTNKIKLIKAILAIASGWLIFNGNYWLFLDVVATMVGAVLLYRICKYSKNWWDKLSLHKESSAHWRKYYHSIQQFTQKYNEPTTKAKVTVEEQRFVRPSYDKQALTKDRKTFLRAFRLIRTSEKRNITLDIGEPIWHDRYLICQANIFYGGIFARMPEGLAQMLTNRTTTPLDIERVVKNNLQQ